MIFVLLPLTGAIIGWITNVLAIRFLFRPLQPLQLGPFRFQGLIPKRRGEIADTVGDVVAEQLFSLEELTGRLDMPVLQQEVERAVRRAVDGWCAEKMTLLPQGVRQMVNNMLRDMVAAEVARQFPQLAGHFFTRMREQVDVRRIVADKINGLSLAEVEGLVLALSRRELRQIEFLGAVLGLLIGVIQALLVWWLTLA
jgi:uncharacterized membrane protein YheB (UPF0754 family)